MNRGEHGITVIGSNWQIAVNGRYKDFDPKREKVILDAQGRVFVMFTNRLEVI